MNWTGEKWENEAKDIVFERLLNDHGRLAELMIDWFGDMEPVDIASIADSACSDNENSSVELEVMRKIKAHFRRCIDEYMRHGNDEVEREVQYLWWVEKCSRPIPRPDFPD